MWVRGRLCAAEERRDRRKKKRACLSRRRVCALPAWREHRKEARRACALEAPGPPPHARRVTPSTKKKKPRKSGAFNEAKQLQRKRLCGWTCISPWSEPMYWARALSSALVNCLEMPPMTPLVRPTTLLGSFLYDLRATNR